MADITKRLFLRHLRANPTAHVRHVRKGKVAHDGAGQAFWFRPLTAALSEVPLDDREQPLLFHARTADFQDVTVQATIAYRIADPTTAAARIDFAIDPNKGSWISLPLEQIGGLLTELAQQHTLQLVAGMTLPAALADGVAAIHERVSGGLAADTRLADIGVVVADVRVIAVRAESDVERALQTPAREMIQQDADKATFERRAVAVERERAISENELQNQIELARREEQLVSQKGQNERKRAEEQGAAERIAANSAAETATIAADAKARNDRLHSAVKAESTREVGIAHAEAEAAHLAAYRELEAATILGLAVKELAGNLPSIGTLNLTPDILGPLFAGLSERLGTPSAAARPEA